MDRKAVRAIKECANIMIDIDSDEEVVDMCKAWSDAQEDAARRAARTASILATVKTARKYGATDEAIFSDIIAQFDLTEKEAREYLLKESA
ncbi:MAG: hypothetical protein LUH18_04155 [Oscillospiraceae bacterium]|nr:hypothetical protein [Oscillospiraceae bacterium]